MNDFLRQEIKQVHRMRNCDVFHEKSLGRFIRVECGEAVTRLRNRCKWRGRNEVGLRQDRTLHTDIDTSNRYRS